MQKEKLLPEHTVPSAGCVVMLAGLLTVNIAALELVLPQTDDATQRYLLPFMEAVTAVRSNVALVAPLILVQLVPPSVLTCHW